MPAIKKINNVDVKISENSNINTSKGLIFIYGYNMSNFEDYKTEIMKEFNLWDVQRATLIRSRSIIASPLLITFNSKQPPSTMNIIGNKL